MRSPSRIAEYWLWTFLYQTLAEEKHYHTKATSFWLLCDMQSTQNPVNGPVHLLGLVAAGCKAGLLGPCRSLQSGKESETGTQAQDLVGGETIKAVGRATRGESSQEVAMCNMCSK